MEVNNQEMYQLYSRRVLHHLVFDFKITQLEADRILKQSNFETDFTNHIEDYLFVEPERIATELFFEEQVKQKEGHNC